MNKPIFLDALCRACGHCVQIDSRNITLGEDGWAYARCPVDASPIVGHLKLAVWQYLRNTGLRTVADEAASLIRGASR